MRFAGLRLFVLMTLALAVPAHARWLVAETEHFRVYSEGSEKGLRKVGDALEGYWALLRDLTGVTETEAHPRLDIYLLPDIRAMREILPGVTNIGGAYATAGTKSLAIAMETSGYSDTLSIQPLFHEVAHHFMFQNRMAAYPTWYVEGFAEYMETATISEARITVGNVNPGIAYTLNSQPWVDATSFFTRKTIKSKDSDFGIFYAQSWLTVHYMFRNPTKVVALRAFLEKANQGKGDAAAFQAAFGTDYAGFKQELRKYLSSSNITMSRYNRRGGGTAAQVAIRTLPPSADDLLLPQARLRLGVRQAERAAFLEKIRRGVAKHPDDSFARLVSAHAETELGDTKTGMAMLDALLAVEPGNAEMLTLRGVAALRNNDTPMGRRLLARAHKLNPVDATSLFHYGLSFAANEAKPSANTLNVLRLAASLAPQAPSISMSTASVLLRAKLPDEAISLLAPVANSPHGGGAASAAQQMIERAKAGRTMDPIEVVDMEE